MPHQEAARRLLSAVLALTETSPLPLHVCVVPTIGQKTCGPLKGGK